MRYRSGGEYTCPMVIRTPYGGGIRGGHYHSQSSEAYFCHTPGLKVVIPSTPADTKGLLISSIRDEDPVMFLEPKRSTERSRARSPRASTSCRSARAASCARAPTSPSSPTARWCRSARRPPPSREGARASRSSIRARSCRSTRSSSSSRCARPAAGRRSTRRPRPAASAVRDRRDRRRKGASAASRARSSASPVSTPRSPTRSKHLYMPDVRRVLQGIQDLRLVSANSDSNPRSRPHTLRTPQIPRQRSPHMALKEFKLPDIGEGIAEGEIVSWKVEPGQHVKEEDEFVEVMTDKATVMITVPYDGVDEGAEGRRRRCRPVESVIAVFDTAGGGGARRRRRPGEGRGARQGRAEARQRVRREAARRGPDAPELRRRPAASSRPSPGKVLAAPATRKLAPARWASTCTRCQGTGPSGRITNEDLQAFAEAAVRHAAAPGGSQAAPGWPAQAVQPHARRSRSRPAAAPSSRSAFRSAACAEDRRGDDAVEEHRRALHLRRRHRRHRAGRAAQAGQGAMYKPSRASTSPTCPSS
jgi:hypothetical protein